MENFWIQIMTMTTVVMAAAAVMLAKWWQINYDENDIDTNMKLKRENLQTIGVTSTQYTLCLYYRTIVLLFLLTIFDVFVVVAPPIAITSWRVRKKTALNRVHNTTKHFACGVHKNTQTCIHTRIQHKAAQKDAIVMEYIWNAAARTFCDFSTHVFVSFDFALCFAVFRFYFVLLLFFLHLSFAMQCAHI